VIESNASRAKARNIGIQHSKGNYILSIDSDMELSAGVIEECLKIFQKDKTVGGIVIPEKSIGNNFWVKVRDFERSFYIDTVIESARFFRKDLIEKVGGYEENIIFFEESTLPQKIEQLGYNVRVRIHNEILHHENILISSWMKKKYYYGKTAHEYKIKYNQYTFQQMSIIHRFSIFLNDKRFFSKPLTAIGVLILKCFEYFAVGLGYIVGRKKTDKNHIIY
jgi:glycosyltransferase involved in cell wall biosynthesis